LYLSQEQKNKHNIATGKMKRPSKTGFYKFRLLTAITVLSLSLVCYQLLLVHFLSIVQWHHFAYMVISIALLGFGASGTLIALYRDWLLQRANILLPFLMICTGLLMPVVLRFSLLEWVRFDSYLLFVNATQFLQLFLTYFLFFLPFFIGSLAIGITFVKRVSDIGVFYFSDLVGAGLGGILAIVFLWEFPPQQIVVIISILTIFSGLMIIRKKMRSSLIIFALVSLVLAGYHLWKPYHFLPSEFKGFSYAMNLPGAVISNEKSSPFGLTQVVTAPSLRYAPGLSLNYREVVPSVHAIYNNGDWYCSIQPWNRKDTIHLLNYTTISSGYALGKKENVLLLNTNSGLDPGHAFSNGAQKITVVEPNEVVISLLKNEYATELDSIFSHSNLTVFRGEPRTFLAKNMDTFDLIQLPFLGAFGGTVGLKALQEENLLTNEAFEEMWHKLTNNGVIVLSAWLDYPNRVPLKCAAAIAESLESYGIDNPLNHIAAVRSWGTITFVIKKTPLTDMDCNAIRNFSEDRYFDVTLLPGISAEERTRYNSIEDAQFLGFLDKIFTDNREDLYITYPYNIKPATDNKPYFSQYLKLEKMGQVKEQLGQKSAPFLELGYLVVVITFIQVLIMAILFIIAPLFKLGWKKGNKLWILLYFCGLGIGFMFLEIVFIKYFVMYLGHPIYSVATVISVMLIFAGLGSFYSSKIKATPGSLMRITAIIVIFIMLYAMLLAPFLRNSIHLQMEIRVFMSVLIIALPSFFMGMPFPIGLRVVAEINKNNVAWAWGINGCISVIAAATASLMAVEYGFIAVLLVSSAAYSMALIANILLKTKA
jgi:hypothetical protein